MSDASSKSLVVEIINSAGEIIGERQVTTWNGYPPPIILATVNECTLTCRYNREQGVYVAKDSL